MTPAASATNAAVHSTVSRTAPRAAGTAAAAVGTLRPRSSGTQRGTASPQAAISPTAVNATSSENTDSRTTYTGSGSQTGRFPVFSAVLASKSTATRHRLDGNTVSGTA